MFRLPAPVLIFLLLASTIGLAAEPTRAAGCCAADEPVLPAQATFDTGLLASPWMFRSPAKTPRRPSKLPSADSRFDYLVRHHWWVQGGVHVLPTGQPLGPETSAADRATYSQAGLGLGYALSPATRVVTNWNRGVGRASVSPGNQFTVGVALRY